MKKRLFSLLLICCMVLCLLPAPAQAEGATASTAAIRSVTDGIHGYNTESGYSYIYYGVWRNAPIKWRVLDTKASTGAAGALFLLTDECLYPLPGDLYACYIQFNPADKSDRHLWKDSTLQDWFKTTFYGGENSAFTSTERALIPATTQASSEFSYKAPGAPSWDPGMKFQICALEAEHVFAPSIQDIMNADYGFTDSASRIAGPSNSLGPGTRYWLRSFEPWEKLPFMVGEDASLYGDSSGDNRSAVRPAMYLTTTGSNILFISAAEGGKPFGGLTEIGKYTGNEWKLTLLDSSRSGFSVTTTRVSTTNYGGDIEITYSGAQTGDNEYISVLLKDDAGNPTYYGRSAALTAASGTVTIPVAAGLAAGNDTLYVYNEQYNGDKKTDYASNFVEVPLTVKAAATYTVTYNPGANGTEAEFTATKLEGTPLTLADESFTRTGYTQTGWATVDGGEKVYDLGATYTADEAITLYPVWTANQYTVTLDSNGGGAVTPSTVTVTYGEDCPAMPVLQWAGHIFDGWYDAQTGGRQYVNDKGNSTARYDKTENCTLYAQWQEAPDCTVTFDPNGGTLNGDATSSEQQNAPIAQPADPTRTGYAFTGWYQDADCTQAWSFSDWLTGDMTLYAGWRANSYTITFDTAGGSAIDPIIQDYGTTINAPAAPTKTGYTFTGWDKTIPATMPAGDMTITAQWSINQYTITFNTDGGSAIDPITQDYGTTINAPAAPTKTGYTFTGWDKTIPATMPAGDMTITAQWSINQYTITFNTDGGSAIDPITQDYGTTINAPAAPTKTGYTFTGWSPAIPVTMPAENVTVTAQWSINQYTVSLDPNGGRVSPDALSVTYLTAYGPLPTPVRSDYRFDGWYLGDEKIEAQTVMTQAANHTLTARWTFQPSAIVGPSRDTLTLETNGGSPIAPIHAARGTTLELSALQPEKSGFRFTGWYLDKALTLPVTSLRLDGDQTVYAGWVSLELPFRDVRPEDWFYADVRYVYEAGLMNGTAEGLFSPDLFTSRAMIVTVLWRLSGSPVVNYYMPFADVDQASWYAEAVRWAASCGIIAGYDNGNFGPNDPVTREQLAAILYRCATYRQEDTSIGADTNILSFTDAASVSEYAVPALQWACGAGILQGADGALLPTHPATRAQTAAILHRFCQQ